MAIYYANAKVLSRSKGTGSAVAAAAYRHNTRMKSEFDGNTYSYSSKDDLVHAEIALPENAPEWAREGFGDIALARALDGREATDVVRNEAVAKLSGQLWNGVEQYEVAHNRRHAEAQLARKFIFALPSSLSLDQQIELAREFVRKSFTDRGMVADWVVHDPKGGENDNPHIHVMTSLRNLGEQDWGFKNRDWNKRDLVQAWRFEWASEVNISLERAGLDERVDHRSYVDQGIELEPYTYGADVANGLEISGQVARVKARAEAAIVKNEDYLLSHPEHILVVTGAKRAVFTEAEMRTEFMSRVSCSVEELEAAFGKVMSSPELVALGQQGPDGSVQYTTKARQTLEVNMVVDAVAMSRTYLDVDSLQGVETLNSGLRDTQLMAAKAMLSSERLTIVTGFAGTGKTFTIEQAAAVWKARGYEVIGGAAAGKATQELMDIKGLEAASLAAWEARWARGRRPSGKFVFIMDEAGMVGSDVWARVQKRVDEMGGKLIAVGDPEQLQPVSDTSAFHLIESRIGATVMDQVVRQEDALEREATRGFALGGKAADLSIRFYEGRGDVHFTNGVGQAIDKISRNYFEFAAAPYNRVALGYSNKDVWLLNDAIRMEGIGRGVIDRSTEVDAGIIERIVRSDDGDKRERVSLKVAVGDRLLFTKAHRALGVPKSSLGTVFNIRETSEGRLLDLVLDGANDADIGPPRPVTVNIDQFNNFDYGFATTVHKSQGMTVDYAWVLGHRYMNQHIAYVGMSRHRKGVGFYAPVDRIKDMDDLSDIVQTKGYMNSAVRDAHEHVLVSSGRSVGDSVSGVDGRADFVASDKVYEVVGFEGDPHLLGVANRISGLLASEYIKGDPVFAEDSEGSPLLDYIASPQKIVDDLVARHSTLRAVDVAGRLSALVRDPDTFARLFRAAMSHPDLVVLSEEGDQGEGRIYSTRAQVALELDVMDRGVRLALLPRQQLPDVADWLVRNMKNKHNLSDEQACALKLSSQGPLTIISGSSGTGKTRLATAVADAHAHAGRQVILVSPTGVGADNLREANPKATVMTLTGLDYAIKVARITLDANTVVVLDEAGLVGASTADGLFRHIEQSGANLVAFRHNDQMGPYEAAPVFQTLEARIGGIELGMQHRSQNAELSHALGGINAGDIDASVTARALNELGVLTSGGTRDASIQKVAGNYISDLSLNKIIVAHSRADVASMNKAVRDNLDGRHPERMEGRSENAKAGSVADLRLGDRIVLSSYYKAARLRPGTRLEVVDTNEQDVVLRLGSGSEAQFVKLDKGDTGFDYKFGFATTLHGSKGRSIDSVHMLATPGMSRNDFHTGAALHGQSLKVVLPTTESHKEAAVAAILQTDGTARSTLDYGFNAAFAARAAMQGQAVQVRETEITRGVARLRGWFGGDAMEQALPHGIGAEVMAELIGGQIIESGKAPSGEVRSALSEMVTQVSDPGRWRKISRQLPGGFVEEESRLAVSKAGVGSDGQALPVARVLARGVLAADHMGESELAARFGRGLDLYAARADEARRTMGIAALEAVQVDHLPEVAWPEVPGGAGPDAFGDRREARNTRQRRPARSLRNLFPTSEAEVARRLVGLIIPNDRHAPGFLDGFLEEWDKHSPRAAGQRGMDLSRAGLERASDSGAEIVINTGVPLGTARADAPEAGTPDAGIPLDGLAERLTLATAQAQAVDPDATSADTDAPTRRLDDLARSLTSAVSQHIEYFSEVHERDDLHRDIRQLLAEGQRFAPDNSDKIEAAAREIAKARRINDIKRALIAEIEPSEVAEMKAVYTDEAPYVHLGGSLQDTYEAQLPGRLANMTDDHRPTETDRDIVRATQFLPEDSGEDRKELAAEVVRAAGYETLPEAENLKTERGALLERLSSSDKITKSQQPDFAVRLYKAFTHKEVDALANPKAALPASLPVQPEMRGILAQLLGPVFASQNISITPWGNHMRQVTRGRDRELERERGSGRER